MSQSTKNNFADQVSRNYEEDIDANEAERHNRRKGVKSDDDENGKSAKSVDFRTMR